MTTRTLEDHEIFAMFAKIQGRYAVRDRTMLMLAIHMALRANELCGLMVGGVYNGSDVRTYVTIRPETAKPGKGRTSRISEGVGKAITDFIDYKATHREPLSPSAALFVSQKGGHLSRKTLFTIVKTLLQSASIHQSPHCLRKTGATIYYN